MDALPWVLAERGVEPPPAVYCPTRDVSEARVARVHVVAGPAGFSNQRAALLAAVAGELTANCFDHNLGVWRDVSGCWFSCEFTPDGATVTVADRGQGFLGSLRRVRPALSSHREAVLLAFTAHVSGRAPEKRGLGLSFVLASLQQMSPARFLLRTGTALLEVATPFQVSELSRLIRDDPQIVIGTYARLTVPCG